MCRPRTRWTHGRPPGRRTRREACLLQGEGLGLALRLEVQLAHQGAPTWALAGRPPRCPAPSEPLSWFCFALTCWVWLGTCWGGRGRAWAPERPNPAGCLGRGSEQLRKLPFVGLGGALRPARAWGGCQ